MEELSPTVYLNKIGSNVQCKELPQVKQEEISLHGNSNLLSIHKEVPITMCNLCNKVLGSQHLLNVHYKQIHGHMFSTENNTTRISASSSQQSICKMEIIENSLHNSDDSILKSSLHEQPQKVCIKGKSVYCIFNYRFIYNNGALLLLDNTYSKGGFD